MHQPFYKDLISGEYQLPWTRLHALKDYYGMVQILEEFPRVRQTFNLVPSMMVQVEEYASRRGARSVSRAGAQARRRSDAPRNSSFILRQFFHGQSAAHDLPLSALRRTLRRAWRAQSADSDASGAISARRSFAICRCSRNWPGSTRSSSITIRKSARWWQRDAISSRAIRPDGPEAARDRAPGDSGIPEAGGSRADRNLDHAVLSPDPAAALRFATSPASRIRTCRCRRVSAIREDARLQLEMARGLYREHSSARLRSGCGPRKARFPTRCFSIAAEVGLRWAATDNGVLARTLRQADRRRRSPTGPTSGAARTAQIRMIFRDHLLSDLIGFVYSGMDAADAARGFSETASATTAGGMLAGGRDALVPIILDGENAWEYYDRNGRPFFRELYGRISDDAAMDGHHGARGLRSEYRPSRSTHIFPGLLDQRQFRCLDRRGRRQQGLGLLAGRARACRCRAAGGPERETGGWRCEEIADCGRQRLELVVRARARIRQRASSSTRSIASIWPMFTGRWACRRRRSFHRRF